MGNLFTYPKFHATDDKDEPLQGGKLYTYASGTNTEKTTYSDYLLVHANRNPVILDRRGEATIYGSGQYKFVLKDSNDTVIWTMNNIDTTLGGSVVGLASEDYVDAAIGDAKAWSAERFITENLLEDARVTNSIRYRTVIIPAGAMTPATTAGCAALATTEAAIYKENRDYLAFDGATEEYAEFEFAFPENWDKGTIKAKFEWSSATGSTAGDTVEWEIKAAAFGDGDALDSPFGTPQVISDTLLANNGEYRQLTAATPAITVAPSLMGDGTGAIIVLGNTIHFRFSRNVPGTDNMTEDAWLFSVILQFGIVEDEPVAW